VTLSLERAVKAAVRNNIAVQFATLGPAIGEAQVAAAEAAFDWTFFSNLNWTNNDSPRVTPAISSAENSQNVTNQTGLRRQLAGGGRLTVQQELSYTDQHSPGATFNPNPASQLQYTLQYDQPLLRNAGSEVAQAEIRVARNAERNAVQTLKRDLLRITADVERTYWQLVQAHRDLLIIQRNVERGEKVRDQLKAREKIDANKAQIADVVARIESRRADVLRAETQLKTVSDKLKSLINDPDFPIGSEVVLLPADFAVDEPVKFNLLDSLRAAITFRPEIQQAILAIDDSSIRRIVADSARLPDLTLRLQTRITALQNSFGDSYREIVDARFVDYIAGIAFEQPIGNRKAEADYRRRNLERLQSVMAYRNTIQQVVGDVKGALDRVVLNYRLIDQTRASRVANAESLRVHLVEKQELQGYTVERLNLELQKQDLLASSERQEVQALADYNTAIADLFAAMGTLLERNQIQFVVPTAAEVLEDAHESSFWYPAGTGGTAGKPRK
jgi:outer membrane protein TolC